MARLIFLIFFVALLWPNSFLISSQTLNIISPLDSPVLFLIDCFDVLVLADPLLQIICIEITLLALAGRVWIWWLLHLPFYIWLPFELGYLYRYSAPSSAHILAILRETSLSEAAGYLGSAGLAWCVVYVLWIALMFWLGFFFYKRNLQWQHRSRTWIIMIFVPLLGIYAYGFKGIDGAQEKLSDIYGDLASYRFSYGMGEFVDTYPFGLPLRVYDYLHQTAVLKRHAGELRKARLNLSRDTRLASEEENYVVVIGESSRAANWSINGYERETTPLLQATDHVVSFTEAVSVAAATRTAVPAMLSQTTAADLTVSRFRNSWINAFKENGFKVYWFSTQMPVGTHDTTIGIYADLADEVRYLNAGSYRYVTEFDGVLLHALQSALADKNKKRLIILHTLGSHTPYQRRYPDGFNKFKPTPPRETLPNIFDTKELPGIVNSYDNSIYYTDYVLSQVIGQLDKTKGVKAMWYASDHGQSLQDGGCKAAGHGFFAKNNFHIPVLFWYSSEYRNVFPNKVAGVTENRQKPIYMGDFFHTILDSLGFDLDAVTKKKSFSESAYEMSPRMVTVDGGKLVDYDTEFNHKAMCRK